MTLDVYLGGHRAGVMTDDVEGRVRFAYDADYRAQPRPTPLSLSMPLRDEEHLGTAPARWIDNLLPDNDRLRAALAAKFGERTDSAYVLLHHVGLDLAGAVQFAPSGESLDRSSTRIPWSSERIASEIDRLRADPATAAPERRLGHWSLAGQFGKFALTRDGDAWIEPRADAPSTHIFKVGMPGLPGSDIAEFVTMRAAAALGIAASRVELGTFEGRMAVIVERFDRIVADGAVRRVHQEDFCQMLGYSRSVKYEFDGGPSLKVVTDAIRRHVTPADRERSLNQLALLQAFNMLIAGTDGHAKNHSLLLHGSEARLAPAYDVISAGLFETPETAFASGRMAFRFGGSYNLRPLAPKRVLYASGSLAVDADWFRGRLVEMAEGVGDALLAALDQAQATTGSSSELETLRDRAAVVGDNCETLARTLRTQR
jgi:serine/threonine-protein kinase HipA